MLNHRIENNVLYMEGFNRYEIIKTSEMVDLAGGGQAVLYGVTEVGKTYKYKQIIGHIWESQILGEVCREKNISRFPTKEHPPMFHYALFDEFSRLLDSLISEEFSEFAEDNWTYNEEDNTLELRIINVIAKVVKTKDCGFGRYKIMIFEDNKEIMFCIFAGDERMKRGRTGIFFENHYMVKPEQLYYMLPNLK